MEPHYGKIGDIKKTNTLAAREETPAYDIALTLLESGFHGMPVVNSEDRVVGKVSEIDLLKALMEGKDLKEVRACEVMKIKASVIHESTPLAEAARLMSDEHLFRLAVVDEKDRLIGTVTRHDVLRGWMGGLGLTREGFWS